MVTRIRRHKDMCVRVGGGSERGIRTSEKLVCYASILRHVADLALPHTNEARIIHDNKEAAFSQHIGR